MAGACAIGLAPALQAAPDDHAGAGLGSAAAPAANPALVAALRDLAKDKAAVASLTAGDADALQAFYASRGYLPLWVADDGLQPEGVALAETIGRLQRFAAISLGPAAAAIDQHRQGTTFASLAELDILLSGALAAAAVNPVDVTAPGPAPDVLQAAAGADDFTALLHRRLPPDPLFWRLRSAIATYRALIAQGGWPAVNPGAKLTPGARDGRIQQVRQRLAAAGEPVAASSDPSLYDDALADAVRRFQARHGLIADGVIGFGTIDAFNMPADARLASMIFNLHRLYAQARDWGDDFLVVNIAAAQMQLVQDGRVTMAANVIVGRTDRQTPELDSGITRLEFNPFWTVPPSVYQKDYLPKVRKDPGFLTSHNIRVFRTAEPANELDPADVDWFSPEAKQMRLRLRQDPGPENALGPAKFLFPNSYDVYVHGTNKQSLFGRAERFLSSGCVRVPDPLGLAAQVLKDDSSWSPVRIEQVVKAGKNLPVALGKPLPVHLVYDTAWVDATGTLQFRKDVYGHDRSMTVVAARGNND